jgi:threonine dehydrogenase-like Zn-dependent dehydrogenase
MRAACLPGNSTIRLAEVQRPVLLERLDRWGLHPESVVSHRFGLAEASEAYRLADSGASGKVGIAW